MMVSWQIRRLLFRWEGCPIGERMMMYDRQGRQDILVNTERGKAWLLVNTKCKLVGAGKNTDYKAISNHESISNTYKRIVELSDWGGA